MRVCSKLAYLAWWLAKRSVGMDFIKKNLAVIISVGVAFVAFVLAIFLPGATAELGSGAKVDANLLGMMFGSATITQKAGSMTATMTYKGAMSIFGLLSFLCLIAGIGLNVASIFIKDKNFDFIGSVLIAVAGVLVFLLLVAGTDLTAVVINGNTQTGKSKFKDVYEIWKLGAGTYIYGILAILGGGFGVANKFLGIVK